MENGKREREAYLLLCQRIASVTEEERCRRKRAKQSKEK